MKSVSFIQKFEHELYNKIEDLNTIYNFVLPLF
jgi:hypothetical protein